MLMDLLHGFEVLSTTEETLFNRRLLYLNINLANSILIMSVSISVLNLQ